MAAGREIVLHRLDPDQEAAIRRVCAEQGCTCGEHLVVRQRPLKKAEQVAGEFNASKAVAYVLSHCTDCPMVLSFAERQAA